MRDLEIYRLYLFRISGLSERDKARQIHNLAIQKEQKSM